MKQDFDKNATSQTVKNGFMATGIFPFDPNHIDFYRCIKNRVVEDSYTPQRSKPNPEQMDNCQFLKILESKINYQLLKQFKDTVEGEDWSGEESAKALFYIWRDCKIEETVNNIGQEEPHVPKDLQPQSTPLFTSFPNNSTAKPSQSPPNDISKSPNNLASQSSNELNQQEDIIQLTPSSTLNNSFALPGTSKYGQQIW